MGADFHLGTRLRGCHGKADEERPAHLLVLARPGCHRVLAPCRGYREKPPGARSYMRIKRVEIIGFKSFCDRAVVNIGESITGVVGPNGCGKSNIVDAIRWCMGEQSAKHLRGKAMEDVIFAGSESRGPAPMAEVSLTFEDVGFSAETLELARHSEEASAEQALETLVPESEESTAQWTDAEGNPIPSPLDEAAAVLADAPPAF